MPGQVRVGDICVGICCCHPPIPCVSWVGVYVTGSTDVVTNGMPSCRIGDMAICSCGHPTFAVGNSGDVKINGRGAHRLGDAVVACPVGVAISASGNTIVNG